MRRSWVSLMIGPTSTPSSNPSPSRSARVRATSASVKSPSTPRSTISREDAVQRCPAVPNAPHSAPSTASSMSASSITTMPFLPPSSSDTFLSIEPHVAAIRRPVSALPGEEDGDGAGVADHRLAGLLVAEHDVDHAGRQARLLEDLDEAQRAQRRVLGGLEHHRVAGHHRREDLPRRDGDRGSSRG